MPVPFSRRGDTGRKERLQRHRMDAFAVCNPGNPKTAGVFFFFDSGLAFFLRTVYSFELICCMGVSRFRLDALNVNCMSRMTVGLVNHRLHQQLRTKSTHSLPN